MAEKDFRTKAMLIVNRNIEEAVILADRIFVLVANPGRIRTEIACGFPQPRDRHDESFQALVDQIYGLMTGRDTRPPAHIWTEAAPGEGSPVDTPLPPASVGGMAGLLEILVAHGGREDLPKLAHELTFEVDDLLPLVDAAQVLGLAEVDDADLNLTDEGRVFVAADILESKEIFAPWRRMLRAGLVALPAGRSFIGRGESALSITAVVSISAGSRPEDDRLAPPPDGRRGRRLRPATERTVRRPRSGRRKSLTPHLNEPGQAQLGEML